MNMDKVSKIEELIMLLATDFHQIRMGLYIQRIILGMNFGIDVNVIASLTDIK